MKTLIPKTDYIFSVFFSDILLGQRQFLHLVNRQCHRDHDGLPLGWARFSSLILFILFLNFEKILLKEF